MLSRLFNSQVLVATEGTSLSEFSFSPGPSSLQAASKNENRIIEKKKKMEESIKKTEEMNRISLAEGKRVLYNKNVMISYLQDYLVSLISFTPCAGTENETELFLISIDSFFHKSVM